MIQIPIETAKMVKRVGPTARSAYRMYSDTRKELHCVRVSLDRNAPPRHRRLSVQAANGFRLVRVEHVLKSGDAPFSVTLTPAQVKAITKGKKRIELRQESHATKRNDVLGDLFVDGDFTIYDRSINRQKDYENLIPGDEGSSVTVAVDALRGPLEATLEGRPKRDWQHSAERAVYLVVDEMTHTLAAAMRTPDIYSPEYVEGEWSMVFEGTPVQVGEYQTALDAYWLLEVLKEFDGLVTFTVQRKSDPVLLTGKPLRAPGQIRAALMPMFVARHEEMAAWYKEQKA